MRCNFSKGRLEVAEVKFVVVDSVATPLIRSLAAYRVG